MADTWKNQQRGLVVRRRFQLLKAVKYIVYSVRVQSFLILLDLAILLAYTTFAQPASSGFSFICMRPILERQAIPAI